LRNNKIDFSELSFSQYDSDAPATEDFLQRIDAGELRGKSLVSPFAGNNKALKFKVRDDIKAALGVAQFYDSYLRRGEWISSLEEASKSVQNAQINLERAFDHLPKRVLDGRLIDQLDFSLRMVSRANRSALSEEEHLQYAREMGVRLGHALDSIVSFAEDLARYARQQRLGNQNPGEPGKIAFVVSLCKSWKDLTGEDPPKYPTETSPFLEYIHCVLTDLGADVDDSFIHAARKAVKYFNVNPGNYDGRHPM
jgi:hypothetical protein